MCYYIAATLPQAANLVRLRQIGQTHAVALKEFPNPSLQAALSRGEEAFLTTTGHCDCGTSVGFRHNALERIAMSSLEKQIAQHRRNGWSDTKIRRWQEQHRNTHTKNERALQSQLTLHWQDAERWMRFLNEILSENDVSFCGLFLHQYGQLEAERFSTLKTVTLHAWSAEVILDLEESVLYRFTAYDKRKFPD